MPAKKRCQFESETRCNQAALRLVGQCPHCRAEFCGTVRTKSGPMWQPVLTRIFSTACRSTTTARIWRAVDSKRSRRTRRSSRVNGRSHPRWPWHDRLPHYSSLPPRHAPLPLPFPHPALLSPPTTLSTTSVISEGRSSASPLLATPRSCYFHDLSRTVMHDLIPHPTRAPLLPGLPLVTS